MVSIWYAVYDYCIEDDLGMLENCVDENIIVDLISD